MTARASDLLTLIRQDRDRIDRGRRSPEAAAAVSLSSLVEPNCATAGELTAPKHGGHLRPLASPIVDIALIQWPLQESRRTQLRRSGAPRLLLVASDSEPPVTSDLMEDWVRLPTSDRDIRARVRSLEKRIAALLLTVPSLDDGVLRHRGHSVMLSPLQARLTGVLIEALGRVASRDEIVAAGWPEGTPSRNTVDVHMGRLRKRIDPLGLTIRTVRARGFMLALESGDG